MSQELTSGRVVGVDADLDVLFDQIKQLRELAGDPDRARDSARVYDFSIRWGTFLRGRLERLDYYYSRGTLTTGEQARYQDLRTELRRRYRWCGNWVWAARMWRSTMVAAGN
jgi:hypothetical protein